jgi:hypothetical protein
MKRLAFLSSTFLIAATLQAHAAPVRWQGEFMITGSSGTCDYDPTGDFGRARFRPGIGGDNGSWSAFSVINSRNAYSYRLNDGLFNTTFKTVDTMGVGDGFGPIDNVVKVKFDTQSPATIKATTNFIEITGQIKGYDYMPQCVINFKMALFKRID